MCKFLLIHFGIIISLNDFTGNWMKYMIDFGKCSKCKLSFNIIKIEVAYMCQVLLNVVLIVDHLKVMNVVLMNDHL